MPQAYDVIGLGSAIVDVLAFCEESSLRNLGLIKGSMALIDEARAEALYGSMGQATECSGGSAANTLAGVASLGGKAAFIGKVKADQLGQIFTHDIRASGVHFSTAPLTAGPATARCLIYVTPDAQRTMNTYLGACTELTIADVQAAPIARTQVLYIEGYLWDSPGMKAAAEQAIVIAKTADKKVALTLSDSFCVERHRATFLEKLAHTDILFSNEHEILTLTEEKTLEAAVKKAQGLCPVVVITRSEKGAAVLAGGAVEVVPAAPISNVVDTTGAGDLFAGGFLFGFTRGWPMKKCAALGNSCAGHIIQQIGARSERPLKALVA